MSNEASRPHVIDGKFQSDKYPTCPRGKVPLSVDDPTAQDLLWLYAQRRRSVDADFTNDLEYCLQRAGYLPADKICDDLVAFTEGELASAAANKFRDHLRTCSVCQEKLPGTLQLEARLSCLNEGRIARDGRHPRQSWDAFLADLAIKAPHVLPVLAMGTLLAAIAAALDIPATTCSAIPLAMFLGIRLGIKLLQAWRNLRAAKRAASREKPAP